MDSANRSRDDPLKQSRAEPVSVSSLSHTPDHTGLRWTKIIRNVPDLWQHEHGVLIELISCPSPNKIFLKCRWIHFPHFPHKAHRQIDRATGLLFQHVAANADMAHLISNKSNWWLCRLWFLRLAFAGLHSYVKIVQFLGQLGSQRLQMRSVLQRYVNQLGLGQL